MKYQAFVIGLSKIQSSKSTADRVIQDLKNFGIEAEFWEGTYGDAAIDIFKKEQRCLQPTSFKGNPIDDDYIRSCTRPGVMGCFHSHYRLWQHCITLNQPILIFEDDVIFERGFVPVKWDDVLLLATGKNVHEQEFYQERLYSPKLEPAAGKFKSKVMPGAVGYALSVQGAKKLVKHYEKNYLPADNAMNMSVVTLQCHTHLMGRAATSVDGKKSLTKSGIWVKRLADSANNAQSD